MKLTCNIDQRGRKARLVTGVIVDLCGVALILVGMLTNSPTTLIAGVFLCLTGSFMIFEGRRPRLVRPPRLGHQDADVKLCTRRSRTIREWSGAHVDF